LWVVVLAVVVLLSWVVGGHHHCFEALKQHMKIVNTRRAHVLTR
jgi:hypothetical protein